MKLINKLYKGDDFFYDHPVITFVLFMILLCMVSGLLGLGIHKMALDTITHQKEMYVEETKEKARICQETGYCQSSNVKIDYENKGDEE